MRTIHVHVFVFFFFFLLLKFIFLWVARDDVLIKDINATSLLAPLRLDAYIFFLPVSNYFDSSKRYLAMDENHDEVEYLCPVEFYKCVHSIQVQ